MNETIESVTGFLGKLYGLPGYALVAIFCAIACYILKGYKKFPNDGIPAVSVLLGMVLNGLIADPISDTLPFRIWLAKNAVFGGICGFVAFYTLSKTLLKDKKPDGPQPPQPT